MNTTFDDVMLNLFQGPRPGEEDQVHAQPRRRVLHLRCKRTIYKSNLGSGRDYLIFHLRKPNYTVGRTRKGGEGFEPIHTRRKWLEMSDDFHGKTRRVFISK